MDPYKYLSANETIIARSGEFYATSMRVIRYRQSDGGDDFHQLPYNRIESIELVYKPRHGLMFAGTVLAVLGMFFFMASVARFTGIPAVVAGIALILVGSRGRRGFYQLRLYNPEPEEEERWRIPIRGTASLVATIRSATGQMPDF